MGAAASVELSKPVDASDIKATGSLEFAAAEVKRLRADLGHLAKLAGIDVVIYDASDILLGDGEDFTRCVNEIAHIRRCLQLNTLGQRRKTRVYGSDEKISVPEVETIRREDGHDTAADSKESGSESESESSVSQSEEEEDDDHDHNQ